jgi:photosystem II stability/assembly factor-like uncharacterized protein
MEVDATANTTARIQLVSYGMNTANQMAGVVDAATAKTYCDNNLGSVFVSPDLWTAGYTPGVFTYYMTTPDGSNPNSNGRAYKFTQRQAPQLGTGNSLQECHVICGNEHNGIVAYNCYLKNVTVWYPGNHATELPGCVTENLVIVGGNINAYTSYAFHHYSVHTNTFDYTIHRNARLLHWKGQFSNAVGIHTDDSTPSIGKLIFFDNPRFDDVDSIAGGSTVDLIYMRGLVGTKIGLVGQPSCNYILERPKLHLWNQYGTQPALQASKTVAIYGGELTFESDIFGNTVANAGTLILDHCKLVQLGVAVQNTFARTINTLAKIYVRECLLSGPLGSGQATLGTTISGGASTSAVAITGSVISPEFTVPTTWMPDGTTMFPYGSNVRADPRVTSAGDDGVTIDFVNSPFRFRHRPTRSVVAPVSNLQPHDILVLSGKDIIHLNTNNGTFAGNPLYTPATPLGLNRMTYVGTNTNQWFIAYGEGGALHKGKSSASSWSQVTNANVTNYTCASAKTTTGIATLGGRDGSLTTYDPATDTFANLTSPIATALYDGFFTGTRWVFVGDGQILVSADNITYTAAAGITAGDKIRKVIGSGNNWCAVCDASVVYYSTDNAATWTRIALAWPIDFLDVAINTNTGDILAGGSPLFGSIAAFKSKTSDMTTWTQVETPLKNIRDVQWAKDYFLTTGSYTLTMWVITGDAFRAYYSQDLTSWTPDNPWPNDSAPTTVYAEDYLLAAIMKTL